MEGEGNREGEGRGREGLVDRRGGEGRMEGRGRKGRGQEEGEKTVTETT